MTLEQCFHLPHITTFNGPRCIFELRTNYNSYLPAPRVYLLYLYINIRFSVLITVKTHILVSWGMSVICELQQLCCSALL
jgi:hypothetical protein